MKKKVQTKKNSLKTQVKGIGGSEAKNRQHIHTAIITTHSFLGVSFGFGKKYTKTKKYRQRLADLKHFSGNSLKRGYNKVEFGVQKCKTWKQGRATIRDGRVSFILTILQKWVSYRRPSIKMSYLQTLHSHTTLYGFAYKMRTVQN